MRFLYPLGLLGLIGIPILIIIYLIKNKYTEQTVASTYLWELSEKFLKRKKKVNPIAGLISLLLQILAVASISLAIANPIIVLPNRAQEICYVIDASASMNMESNGETRLERAKEYVEKHIKDSVRGSVYSLVTVSDTTTIVYERNYDYEDAIENLATVQAGYVETDSSDAIELVQTYFTANPGVKVYFITDCNYLQTENINVINVADGEKNVAVSPLEAKLSGSDLTVSGSIRSYEYTSSVEVRADLYVNNASSPVETQTLTIPAPVAAAEGVEAVEPTVEFSFTKEVASFEKVRVVISGVADNYAADNETILYNVEKENAYDVLVVSDTPFLISSAIKATGNAQVSVVSTADYKDDRGYGLYVFDGYAPENVPTDGAVWFMNVKSSVRGTGFSYQGEDMLGEGETLSLTTSSSALAERLTADMAMENVYISSYIRYGRSRHFTPLIMYKNNPVVFTGVTDSDNREVVFAFDIHQTDFPMHMDFTILVRNLLNYSFPPVLEEVFYYSGDTLEVNLLANTEAVRVEAPSGNHVYLSTAGAIAEYRLDEVGVHKITVTLGESGAQRSYYVYAGVPESERNPYTQASYVGLQGEATDGGLEGNYDTLWIVFAFLALVFLADWAVYCYEKYQLR